MVFDTALLNTQQYKVRTKGKVEKFRERSSVLPLHLSVVSIEKGAFWSPSTTIAKIEKQTDKETKRERKRERERERERDDVRLTDRQR